MRAEIVAVGTELLLGETVDTNSAWLAGGLADLGWDVYWSQRVGDNLERVTEALRQALGRSDLVLTSGGLGPTDDDLTREAIALVVGETPQVAPELEADLRAVFGALQRAMPPSNLKQAWLIPSAEALDNPVGTAPGWWVRHQGRILAALPGPPAELQRMWEHEVRPRLPHPEGFLYRKTFKAYGQGESMVAQRLGGLTRGANPSVATYAHADGVHVRVAARGGTPAEAEALAEPVAELVRDVLSGQVWGTDDQTMASVLKDDLLKAGRTFATVESLTGGQLAAEVTAVPQISQVYRGGAVTYHAATKEALGVPGEVVTTHGVVSDETAAAMAKAGAAFLGADYAVSTTGVAGPDSLEGKPPGRVHVGLWGPAGAVTRTFDFPKRGRRAVQERTVYAALWLLLQQVRADSTPG